MTDGCPHCHNTGELHRQDCGAHGMSFPCPACARNSALDTLIAGDADLYEVTDHERDAWDWLHMKYKDHPNDRDFGSDDMVDAFMAGRHILSRDIDAFAKALETGLDFNVVKHLDIQMCCNGHHCGCQGATVGQYLAHELRTASARIKGDKDRENPVERPQHRAVAIEAHRLRAVLRYIADVAYVNHQSGNENFEYLQSLARSALALEDSQ